MKKIIRRIDAFIIKHINFSYFCVISALIVLLEKIAKHKGDFISITVASAATSIVAIFVIAPIVGVHWPFMKIVMRVAAVFLLASMLLNLLIK